MQGSARGIRIVADDDLKVLKGLIDGIRELNTVITSLTPQMTASTRHFHDTLQTDLSQSSKAVKEFLLTMEKLNKQGAMGSGATATGAGMGQFAQQAKDMDQALTKLTPALTGFTNAMKPLQKDVPSAFASTAAAMEKFVVAADKMSSNPLLKSTTTLSAAGLTAFSNEMKLVEAAFVALAPTIVASQKTLNPALRSFHDDFLAAGKGINVFLRAADKLMAHGLFTQGTGAMQVGQNTASAGLQAALANLPIILNMGPQGATRSANALQKQISAMVNSTNVGLTQAERDLELNTGQRLGEALTKGIRLGMTNRQLGTMLKNTIDNMAEEASAVESGQRLAQTFVRGVQMGLTKGELKSYVNKEFQQILREGEVQLLRSPEWKQAGSILLRSFASGMLDAMPRVKEALTQFSNTVKTIGSVLPAPLELFGSAGRHLQDILQTQLKALNMLRIGFMDRLRGAGAMQPGAPSLGNVLDMQKQLGQRLVAGFKEGVAYLKEYVQSGMLREDFFQFGMLLMRYLGNGFIQGGRLLGQGLTLAVQTGLRLAQAVGSALLQFGRWAVERVGDGIRAAGQVVGSAFRMILDAFHREPNVVVTGQETGRRLVSGMIEGLFGEQHALRRAGVGLIHDGFWTLSGSGLKLLIEGQGAQTAMAFEQQMKLVEVFGDLTVAEVERVKETIFSVAMETIFDPTEQADAFLTLLKSGLSVPDAEAVLKPLADFALASQDTLTGASEKMIQAMSMFDIPLSNIQRGMDALVGGADISITTVQDLAHALTFAPVAPGLGVELEEVVTALAVLADSGINATRGGTALRAVLSSLVKPTEKAQGAMSRLGLDIKDQEGNFVGMSAFLNDIREGVLALETQGLGRAEIIEVLALLGDRVSATGLLSLIQVAEDGTLVFDQYADKLEEARSTTEIAGAISDTFAFKLDALGNAVEELNIKAFTPFLNDVLAPFVIQLTEMISELADIDPTALRTVLTLVAGVSALAASFAVLQIGVGVLAVVSAGMATFGAILTSPLLLLAGAATAVSLVFVDLDTVWSGFLRGLDAGATVLNNAAERLGRIWDKLIGMRNVFNELIALIPREVNEEITPTQRGVFSNLRRQLYENELTEGMGGRRYTVQAGDTLYDLAQGDPAQIQAMMTQLGLTDARHLQVGMELTLPVLGQTEEAMAALREGMQDLPTHVLLTYEGATKRVDARIKELIGSNRTLASVYDNLRSMYRDLKAGVGAFNTALKVLQETMTTGLDMETITRYLDIARDQFFRAGVMFGYTLGEVFSLDGLAAGLRAFGQSDFESAFREMMPKAQRALQVALMFLNPFAGFAKGFALIFTSALNDDIANLAGIMDEYDIGTRLLRMLPQGAVSTAQSYLDVLTKIGQADFTGAVKQLGIALQQTFTQLGGLLRPDVPEGTDPADIKFYTQQSPLQRIIDDLKNWVMNEAPAKLQSVMGSLLAALYTAAGEVFTLVNAQEFFIPQLIDFVDESLDEMAVNLLGESENDENGFTRALILLLDNTGQWIQTDGAAVLGKVVGTLFAALGDALTALSRTAFQPSQWGEFASNFMDNFATGFAQGALAWWDVNEIYLPLGGGFYVELKPEGMRLVNLKDLTSDLATQASDLVDAIVPRDVGTFLFGGSRPTLGQQLLNIGDVPLTASADLAVEVNELMLLYEGANQDLPYELRDLRLALATTDYFDLDEATGQLRLSENVGFRLTGTMSEADRAALNADLAKLGGEIVTGLTAVEVGTLELLGANLINGIENGILGEQFPAGDYILGQIRDQLEIKSPSLQGVLIGQDLAEGVQMGFESKFLNWDVNDLIFGAYAISPEEGEVASLATEGATTPFSAVLVDVNTYVLESVPAVLLAHETLRFDVAMTDESLRLLGQTALAEMDGIMMRVNGVTERVRTARLEVNSLALAFTVAGQQAQTGTSQMVIALDVLHGRLKQIAPLADTLVRLFNLMGQGVPTLPTGTVPGKYAGGQVRAGTLAEVAEVRRGVGFEILQSGGRSYLYGNADVNVVSPYAADTMGAYRSVGTENVVNYGGDTSVQIVVNADGSMVGGDYNGLAADVADLVMARVNRQRYGRRGLSTL